MKSRYTKLVDQKGRLVKVLEESEKQIENKRLELKYATGNTDRKYNNKRENCGKKSYMQS